MRIVDSSNCSVCGCEILYDMWEGHKDICDSCSGLNSSDIESDGLYSDGYSGHCAGCFWTDDGHIYVDGQEANWDDYFDSPTEDGDGDEGDG